MSNNVKDGIRQLINYYIIILFITVIIGPDAIAQTSWTEDSFEDFRDGQFLDAGSNLYVSAKGRIQIITRWDFNNDGNLDILIPAGHGHTEKENIFVYLNNGSEIDGRSRIELPGGGSRDGLVYDFNKDGYNDIAIANASDSHFSRVNAWIYFGSAQGFLVENRVELPAYRGRAVAIGDFNNDSWMDLAIACQWQGGTITKPEGPKMSFIYWNSAQGFRDENRMPLILDGNMALDLAAADLDNDGKDDLVVSTAEELYFYLSSTKDFAKKEVSMQLSQGGSSLAIGDINGDENEDLAICYKNSVVMLFGSGNGYSLEKSSSLNVSNPLDVELADIDRNGNDEIIVANFSNIGGATWTDSYIFSLTDKNLNNFSSQKLPTLGAVGVSADDLNQDDYPEIVFSNQRITNQLNINSYIYWNDKGKFYFGNHTQLPTLGPMANTIGDVNNDGLADVIFLNEEGYFRDGPTTSYLYWGVGTRNFSKERSISFSTHHIFGHGHADLDDDGNVDLVLARERFVARVSHEQNGLAIYWGDSDQFSAVSNLTMTTAYGGVRIADINKDGYLDMVAGGAAIDLTQPNEHGFPVFWGSEKGFSNQNRTIIHHNIEKMRAPLLMDLNRDNWLDIVGQVEDGKIKIWWGSENHFHDEKFTEIDLGREDHLMYIKGADFNKDGWLDILLPKRRPHEDKNTSFIYYGSANGFSEENRIKIKSDIAYESSIADFNKDGWLDIFLPSYGTDLTGNRPSVIHWGGENGYNSKPFTELTTYGPSGSEALDYDNDGWLDLLIVNHRKAGSTTEPIPHKHTTPALLYWGGTKGFSDKQMWEVEATGPSGLNIRDLGNSYDRGLYEDYISSAYEIPENENARSIAWQTETNFGTSVKFQVRVADTKKELLSSPWFGADGKNSWFTKSGSKIEGVKGKWIQYRARLITPNGGATPYLSKVVIEFK